jgi:hypothetical protein
MEELLKQYQEGKVSLAQMQKAITSSPEMAKYLADQQELVDQGKRTAVKVEVLDALKNVGLTAAALRQISGAKGAAANLRPVQPPTVPGLSPELSQAIFNAQGGAAPVIAPAQQGIEDAYQGAISQAREASGGQAGAYQAMSQLANVERMKAQLGLAPIAQQAQLQGQANLNGLIGARVDERQQQYLNSLYGAQMAQDQYQRDQAAIGGLGQAGYTNLFGMAAPVTNNLQNLARLSEGENWFNGRISGFDPETQKYMQDVRSQNISRNPLSSYGGSYRPDNEFYYTSNV